VPAKLSQLRVRAGTPPWDRCICCRHCRTSVIRTLPLRSPRRPNRSPSRSL
jgi:hypothetical protein